MTIEGGSAVGFSLLSAGLPDGLVSNEILQFG
jgi:hypothetical protein